ncbi:hypothetical protein CWI84_09555 [Idiomarina tyrosinivorans]|uniref:Uncharacterized protein n=1 Tax=Idiomarina tyrosinivorans TaxID=1445662 RepID=A0A432ZPT3_9GAMM|nr:hypothetical protein [Idiomarina tyrosinivorans]RUO79862.1 hypothetical protein CWI84_09555 [Idiomarina tyrosinivorans]
MSETGLILNFQNFIVSCWPHLNCIMRDLDWDNEPYFIEDWLQANWELLVEKHLGVDGVLLPSYGYEADTSNRYKKTGTNPSHKIMCSQFNSENKYLFLSFISKNGNALSIEPPFDYLKVKDDQNNVNFIKSDGVKFYLEPFFS